MIDNCTSSSAPSPVEISRHHFSVFLYKIQKKFICCIFSYNHQVYRKITFHWRATCGGCMTKNGCSNPSQLPHLPPNQIVMYFEQKMDALHPVLYSKPYFWLFKSFCIPTGKKHSRKSALKRKTHHHIKKFNLVMFSKSSTWKGDYEGEQRIVFPSHPLQNTAIPPKRPLLIRLILRLPNLNLSHSLSLHVSVYTTPPPLPYKNGLKPNPNPMST